MTNIDLSENRVLHHILFRMFLVQGRHDTSYSEVLDKFLVKPAQSAKKRQYRNISLSREMRKIGYFGKYLTKTCK